MKKIIYTLVVCILIVLSCSACAGMKGNYYEKSNIVMDTAVTLSAYGKNSKEAVEESFKRLKEIEEMSSTTINTSDSLDLISSSNGNFSFSVPIPHKLIIGPNVISKAPSLSFEYFIDVLIIFKISG